MLADDARAFQKAGKHSAVNPDQSGNGKKNEITVLR